jgi:hypothetical protein
MAHWEYCLRAAVWGIKLVHDEDSALNSKAESSIFRMGQTRIEAPSANIQHPEKIQVPNFKNH